MRLYRPGYQVKQRRFARAVWADDTFNHALRDIYTDIVNGVKTAEKPMQALCFEKRSQPFALLDSNDVTVRNLGKRSRPWGEKSIIAMRIIAKTVSS